jgi:hypothetical protein
MRDFLSRIVGLIHWAAQTLVRRCKAICAWQFHFVFSAEAAKNSGLPRPIGMKYVCDSATRLM